MALPTYQLNSIPTVDEFNAFLRPKFTKKATEEEFPGFLHQLTDDQLSDDLPNVKPQWQGFRDELLVTAGSGLNINYKGGIAYSTFYQPLVVAPGTIALVDNSDNFIYLDNGGVVRASTRAPRLGFRMAIVTTLNGGIIQVVDRRRRFQISPPFSQIKVLGGYTEVDYDLQGSDTLSGRRSFRNFRLRSTAALAVTRFLYLEVAEDVTIDAGATITISPAAPGGTGISGINTSIAGGYPGLGLGSSSTNFPVAAYEDFDWWPVGSGGASGFAGINPGSASDTTNFIYLANGGAGGGGIYIECGGTVTINGSIIAKGGTATLGSSSVANNTNLVITGAGGGSGGRIKIVCPNSISLGATAVLDVSGGGGSNAVNLASGGGGGGGGRIILVSPVVNLIQGYQVLVAGGAAGANVGTIQRGGTAGASFGGQGGAITASGSITTVAAGTAGNFSIQYRIP